MDAQNSLFEQLKVTCADDWKRYTHHDFVARIGDGTLPERAFRHYLIQDYLFLIQFARAYALAVYKSETLADMRQAGAGMSAILDTEMALHVEFCREWGLSEADIETAPEASACMAYTRFVLERGMSGDLLDLHIALAPCIVGYAEIGARLASNSVTSIEGNPYLPWIEMYASSEYQDVAAGEISFLEDLMRRRAGPGRFNSLADTFGKATRLEVEFWQMGLDHAGV
jgi:thiaminase/transcriptional activator TenA